MADSRRVVCTCAASGAPVLVEGGPPSGGKTLALSSVAAISALLEEPEAQWAKAASVDVAGRRRVWYAWTDAGEAPGEDWNHGAVFAADKATVEAGGEEPAAIRGSLTERRFEGFPEARVQRGALADDEIMRMYEDLKSQLA